ncbi:hypothetical protein ABG067_007716, partial [Albugo candida]
STLIETKQEELTTIYDKLRISGDMAGSASQKATERQIKKEIKNIKVLSYDRSATLVTKWTQDFVIVTKYKACSKGCTLFELSDSDEKVCKLCEAELLENSKKNVSNSKDDTDNIEDIELTIRKKQVVHYVHLEGQLKSMFIQGFMREALKYGAEYESTEGVYRDVFDGSTIKSVCDDHNSIQVSSNEYVIYVGIMQDGFNSAVHHSKSRSFTMFQVVCYSLSPILRNGMKLLVMISPGPNKPSMESFTKPLLEELKTLYKDGFTVKVGDDKYKVFVKPILATGDGPAIADIFMLKTILGTNKVEHMAKEQNYQDSARSKSYYKANLKKIDEAVKKDKKTKAHLHDETKGVKGRFALADLPSFKSMAQSGLDDLHFINRGITPILFDAFTTTKYYNKNLTGNKADFDRLPLGVPLHHYIYPFTLKLENKYSDVKTFINKEISEARKYVPPYMSGSYLEVSSGTRACDWEDVLLRVLPSTIIPLVVCREARIALESLIVACSIALQWFITEEQLDKMDSMFKVFLDFLVDCVNHDTIDPCVMTVTSHYCMHVASVIRECGPLRIISARSLEIKNRQIGVAKKLIKSKSNPGMNAQNACVSMVKANVLKRMFPFWDVLGEKSHDSLLAPPSVSTTLVVPSLWKNYVSHVANFDYNLLEFGGRSVSLNYKKFISASKYDHGRFFYTRFCSFTKNERYGDLFKNIPLKIFALDLFNGYLEKIGGSTILVPPRRVLLFGKIELNVNYCVPNTSRSLKPSDVNKKFVIRSMLSSVNRIDGEFSKKANSQRSRFIIYKKQHLGQTVLSV